MIFSKLFKTKPAFAEEVQQICISVVNQSRQEVFFAHYDVADTPEGRFDMIAMHMFLVMRRLKADPERTADFSQSLYDLMFADMDINLRELGVGDMGLARRVPKMAEAFSGRIKVYEEGLSADDADETLKAALDRNLYRKTIATAQSLSVVAQYLRTEAQNVESQSIDNLLAGKVSFGEPPAAPEKTDSADD